MALLDLDDVKQQLGITSTTHDAQLQIYVDAATVAVEVHTDETTTSTPGVQTLTFPGTATLSARPLTGVTAATDSAGASIDLSRFGWDALGQVTSDYIGAATLTYTAGYATPPPNYVLGGMIIVQHLWESRRGGMPISAAELVDSLGVDRSTGTLVGFAIPNKALELLGRPVPIGFA